MTIELNSKVLHIIYNRKWIKDITGDSFSGNITIFLHDGFTFADTGLTTAVFSTVRKAALGASRNTVINHNAKPKRVAKPKKKVELKEVPFVGPMVDRNAKGKVLSMTPNAIRKRKKKAA